MLKIIYEDKNLIALNKPAGILVHGAVHKDEEPTLVQELLKQYPKMSKVGEAADRPGIVHRLDKDTSGVLIVAKNQQSFEHLKRLFQNHEVKKNYLALVWGRLGRAGIINKPIGLKPGTVKRSTRSKQMKMVKAAVTEYRLVKNIGDFSLIRVFPKTGRTHQIRVHLASIGHPIVGDKLYGRKDNPFSLGRQFLHAESIEFTNVNGERLKIEADLPEELKTIIMGKHESRDFSEN